MTRPLLTKLGIRYYDPTLGRFTQPDPTGQDPHYTYAGNSPCTYTDPTGAHKGISGLCKNRVGVVFREIFGPIAAGDAIFGFTKDLGAYATAKEDDFRSFKGLVGRQFAGLAGRLAAKAALPVTAFAGGGELICLGADAYDNLT